MRTRSLSRAALAASLATLLAGSAAQAERIDLVIFENAPMADVSGLDLWVDVLPGDGDTIDFVFHNDSTTPSVVTSVYFDASSFATLALASPRITDESMGVMFSEAATPRSPAGSVQEFGGRWDSLYSADADSPGPFNGINANVGETLTVRFDLTGGATVQEVVNAITDDPSRFRIAQHIQGLPDGASVWSITVPSPGSIGLVAAGVLLIAGRRR